LIRRAARENEERRLKEQQRDTISRRATRDNEERQEQEQVRYLFPKNTEPNISLPERTTILLLHISVHLIFYF